MLARRSRLRQSQDFSETVRRGARAGRPLLVVHLDPGAEAAAADSRPGLGPRAGFVVSKNVGNSVVRHRVTRRLRHLVAPRLDRLPDGARLVIRALPGAADASSAELALDLDAGLERARRRAYAEIPRHASAGAP